ncbi:GNAT family N-acetyltransferase [Zobellia sp.]|nr:GNAT family N-acetyltransferase [Zobellia sp.]
MKDLEEQLKNPVWYSLRQTHKKFATELNGVQFYDPEVCTFGSFFDETKTTKAANEYVKKSNNFFFVSENQTPIIDDNKVFLEKKIDGCQMVLNELTDVPITEDIVLLEKEFIDEIYDLVWLVMPGYYQKRTFEMGKYFGVFKNGKLVSITGQRMQTNHFIEVSAVVTHPDYTRKGLAKQLIAHTTKEILKENKTPILHTNKGNPAIFLYEKLGYELTRDMNWWLYRKKESVV